MTATQNTATQALSYETSFSTPGYDGPAWTGFGYPTPTLVTFES